MLLLTSLLHPASTSGYSSSPVSRSRSDRSQHSLLSPLSMLLVSPHRHSGIRTSHSLLKRPQATDLHSCSALSSHCYSVHSAVTPRSVSAEPLKHSPRPDSMHLPSRYLPHPA